MENSSFIFIFNYALYFYNSNIIEIKFINMLNYIFN